MSSKIQTKNSLFPTILRTGLLVGTLDITAAFINSYVRSGVYPSTVLKFIASGVLGQDAFSGGVLTALLGLFFHYFIAFSWTILFFVVYPKIKLSSRYKILVGLSYGVIVWIVMNIIVLPLSRVPRIPFHLSQFILGVIFLMLLIGLPISLIFHSYYRRINNENHR